AAVRRSRRPPSKGSRGARGHVDRRAPASGGGKGGPRVVTQSARAVTIRRALPPTTPPPPPPPPSSSRSSVRRPSFSSVVAVADVRTVHSRPRGATTRTYPAPRLADHGNAVDSTGDFCRTVVEYCSRHVIKKTADRIRLDPHAVYRTRRRPA
ncbi:Hypothetical protein CINCED_3A021141, partial [Cinara cedri]